MTQSVALEILSKPYGEPLKRFQREVDLQAQFNGMPGIYAYSQFKYSVHEDSLESSVVLNAYRPTDPPRCANFVIQHSSSEIIGYAVAHNCNVRTGEVLGLQRQDIDVGHGLLPIRRSMVVAGGKV